MVVDPSNDEDEDDDGVPDESASDETPNTPFVDELEETSPGGELVDALAAAGVVETEELEGRAGPEFVGDLTHAGAKDHAEPDAEGAFVEATELPEPAALAWIDELVALPLREEATAPGAPGDLADSASLDVVGEATVDTFAVDRLAAAAQEVETISETDEVEQAIEHALLLGASDIHFTPQAHALVVRARIDGVMRELRTIPSSQQA